MARPVKDPNEKLSEVVKYRCTLAELEHVRNQATAAALSVSEYARRRALSLPVQPPPRIADAALVSEINRIGVNVNQLARSQNADREFRGDWKAIEAELRRVLAKVAEVYGS
jgi:hypothetical protein